MSLFKLTVLRRVPASGISLEPGMTILVPTNKNVSICPWDTMTEDIIIQQLSAMYGFEPRWIKQSVISKGYSLYKSEKIS